MPKNNRMLDMEFTLQIYEDTRPLRIGFIVSEGHHIPLPPCQRAVEEAKSILKNQGHTVSHLSLSFDGLLDVHMMFRWLTGIL